MNQVILLARQHLREQRWALASLVVYVLVMALAFGVTSGQASPEDLLFFARQQASFAVLFTLFLSTSVLHAERRSRRLLAVLSKAISRGAYVGSVLIAMWAAAALYCVTSCAALEWIGRRAQINVGYELRLLGLAFVAAAATAAIAVFFSTFLHPLVGTFVSGALIAIPSYLGQFSALWLHISPASALMGHSTGMIVLAGSSSLRYWIALALIQTVVFWAGAAFVFTKLDLAVPLD